MRTLWGIDLGGTKIEGVVMPGDGQPDVLCRLRLPTEVHLGYDHVVSQIAKLVGMMGDKTGIGPPARIGIGTPGTVDPPTGWMKNCNTTMLNGRPLPEDIQTALGREVVIANDANCFALAEATLGSAKGEGVVFGVIMGTGVGGGIVVDGKVLGGAQGIAGEWGHNVLEPNGTPCYCGKFGCVETVLSGPALERFYQAATGTRSSLAEIVRKETDDPAAKATIDRLCQKFGEGLSVVVNIFDSDVIVLGGGVGNIDALYNRGRDELEKWVFNNRLTTRLVRPSLGDSAGVFGAAMLTA